MVEQRLNWQKLASFSLKICYEIVFAHGFWYNSSLIFKYEAVMKFFKQFCFIDFNYSSKKIMGWLDFFDNSILCAPTNKVISGIF